MKPCPNCGEKYISSEAVLAETIPFGIKKEGQLYRTYDLMGAYYLHPDGKMCVKEVADVVHYEEPIYRVIREAKCSTIDKLDTNTTGF